tara:strand:- start:575 stop:985 length:411 start_codon:yes stop_codon:yes gene_type:complete
MESVSKEYLVKLAQGLLFENKAQINLPVDDGMYASNSRMSMYDRPGPNINGEQEYETDEEHFDEEDMPISASDVVSNTALIQVDFDPLDKEYVPDNKVELSSAMSAYLDTMGNNELDKEVVTKVWKNFVNIIDKVT